MGGVLCSRKSENRDNDSPGASPSHSHDRFRGLTDSANSPGKLRNAFNCCRKTSTNSDADDDDPSLNIATTPDATREDPPTNDFSSASSSIVSLCAPSTSGTSLHEQPSQSNYYHPDYFSHVLDADPPKIPSVERHSNRTSNVDPNGRSAVNFDDITNIQYGANRSDRGNLSERLNVKPNQRDAFSFDNITDLQDGVNLFQQMNPNRTFEVIPSGRPAVDSANIASIQDDVVSDSMPIGTFIAESVVPNSQSRAQGYSPDLTSIGLAIPSEFRDMFGRRKENVLKHVILEMQMRRTEGDEPDDSEKVIRDSSTTISLKRLPRNSVEFLDIKRKINNRTIKVRRIFKVSNPYLEKAFLLKKHEKSLGNQDLRETLLFHGTKKENVEQICHLNFDWRLCGKNKGSRFGKGVYFSEDAKYASNYGDVRSNEKVMIVVKVLIGRTCQGHPEMVLPNPGCDTSVRKMNNDIVVVKYEESQFCPAYVIYYHIARKHWLKNKIKLRNA